MTEVQIVKLVVGLVAGIWPLFVGFRSKKVLLSGVGFLLTLAGGLLAGFILAAPVAVGCGWFIERQANAKPDEERSSTESSAEESHTHD